MLDNSRRTDDLSGTADSNGTTNFNTDYEKDPFSLETLAIVMPVVVGVIVILGLIGNGLVIGAVLRYKSMRSAPNVFIVNLAVGDILLNLISLPTVVVIFTVDGWPYGLELCKTFHFLRTLTLGLSIFTLTALSIDRVLVISQTLKLWQKTTTHITIMVVVVWILAIIVAVPDAISYHLKYFEDEDHYICRPHPPNWVAEINYHKIHSATHIAVFFIIPLIIITICYGKMAHVMVKSAHGIPGESTESSTWRLRQIKTRRKVANIMIALIVLFFICWLPRSIIVLYSFFGINPRMTPTLHYIRVVAICLMSANGCVNPIALYFLSKSFNTHFKKQLCCGKDASRITDTDLGTVHDYHPMSRLVRLKSYPETDVTAVD